MSILPTAPTRSAPSPDQHESFGRNRPWCLIYHSGAVGDFITTIPALVCWRKLVIDEQSVLLTHRAHGELAVQAALVDEAWEIDEARFSRLFLGDGSTMAAAPPDRALLFTAVDSPLVDALRNAGCRELTVQPPFPRAPEPIVEYHLSLFRNPPAPGELFRPLETLGTARSAGLGFGSLVQDAVLVHPGSGGAEKIWPSSRFGEVAGILRQRGERVVWCLGHAERDFRPPLEDTVLREPALADLCGVLTAVRCYLGNDSGISHLAVACGCPSVVLFGPSDDRIWAPKGEAVEIVAPPGSPPDFRRRDIRKIEIRQVLSAIDKLLDARRSRTIGK